MPRTETSFKAGNKVSQGVRNKPGRPPDIATMALRDFLRHEEENEESVRTEAIQLVRAALRARDVLGHPNATALNAAKLVVQVTDPEDMNVREQAVSGDVVVTIEYVGGPAPDISRLPRYGPPPAIADGVAPSGPDGDPLLGQAVQRRKVRSKVRKNNARRG